MGTILGFQPVPKTISCLVSSPAETKLQWHLQRQTTASVRASSGILILPGVGKGPAIEIMATSSSFTGPWKAAPGSLNGNPCGCEAHHKLRNPFGTEKLPFAPPFERSTRVGRSSIYSAIPLVWTKRRRKDVLRPRKPCSSSPICTKGSSSRRRNTCKQSLKFWANTLTKRTGIAISCPGLCNL